MNRNMYSISFIISIIFLIIFFALEYDRKTLRGTYIGYKCHMDSNNTFLFNYNILELNYDNTFQFQNKNKNYKINGRWEQFNENKIIFTTKEKNKKNIATFNRHNIHFMQTDNKNTNDAISYIHMCATYPGSEKQWWGNLWGLLGLVIFLFSMLINMFFLFKLYKK